MTHVFISPDDAKLKSYGAVSRGGKSVVRIELEIIYPFALARLLEQLADFEQQQRQHKRSGPAARPVQRMLPPPSEFE